VHPRRKSQLLFVACALVALGGCQSRAPAPILRPAAFTPLGLNAPYLFGDVIGGTRARAAKMRAAKIRPLTASESPAYFAALERELRTQTAGIGLDVLRIGNGLVIRIPAALTFDTGSSSVKPQFDATLLEISRTVKAQNRTYVDVFAHTDLSGTPAGNQALSDKRAAAVANYLSNHGVAKARIASKGLGETAPLYNPEANETQQAANRRVEIRLLPYSR
jgi:outer membrane protein OmpA-like peptidoglycan-associated protein